MENNTRMTDKEAREELFNRVHDFVVQEAYRLQVNRVVAINTAVNASIASQLELAREDGSLARVFNKDALKEHLVERISNSADHWLSMGLLSDSEESLGGKEE